VTIRARLAQGGALSISRNTNTGAVPVMDVNDDRDVRGDGGRSDTGLLEIAHYHFHVTQTITIGNGNVSGNMANGS